MQTTQKIQDRLTRNVTGNDPSTLEAVEQQRLNEQMAKAKLIAEVKVDDQGLYDLSAPEIKEAFKDLTSNKAKINWFLCAFNDACSGTKLELSCKGNGGYAELLKTLKANSGKIFFGCFTIIALDDEAGVMKRPKYVYLTFQGTGAPFQLTKMIHRQTNIIGQLFKGYHLHQHITSLEKDFGLKTIGKLALSSMAAHKPISLNFGSTTLKVEDIDNAPDDD